MSVVDRRVRKLCPVTRKRKYRDKVDVLVSNKDRPKMSRAYLCTYCNFWHLTSKR